MMAKKGHQGELPVGVCLHAGCELRATHKSGHGFSYCRVHAKKFVESLRMYDTKWELISGITVTL